LMNSVLGWLLLIATPLFAAVKAGRKKQSKKPAKKKIKFVRACATSLRAKKADWRARPATRKHEKRKQGAARGRPLTPQKPATPKPAPTATIEPPPKPVAPTGRAILLSPENEKYADSVHPIFRWLSVGGATRYEIAWSEDANFATGHSVFSIATEATVPVEKPLRVGATYYWRVRGGNESGWGPWSFVASFRVLEEAT
jgi:hypothetical protein